MMAAILAAFSFLTVLPVGGTADEETLRRSVYAYPLVGAVLGALEGGLALLLRPHLSAVVGATLVLLLDLFATRALHWDGLLDTADGLAAHPRDRAEAAMRDPRLGAAGALAAGAFLFLRVGLVASLGASLLLPVLTLALTGARLLLAGVVVLFPYARSQGVGSTLRGASSPPLLASLAFTALITLVGPEPLRAAVVVLAALLVAFALAHALSRRFGGLTGDLYGALTVLTELFILLGFAWR
jgi:cobalamin 5'-phosphate synthase/cobalamin synthase